MDCCIPPPTTTTGWSRYRKPSHVAQVEIPPPRNSSSPSTPSHRELAPVATMTECVGTVMLFLVVIRKGLHAHTTHLHRSKRLFLLTLLMPTRGECFSPFTQIIRSYFVLQKCATDFMCLLKHAVYNTGPVWGKWRSSTNGESNDKKIPIKIGAIVVDRGRQHDTYPVSPMTPG